MNTTCLVHIVDDDAAVRTACAFLMEALGHAHQTWEHGQAFLDQVDCHRPAVALIDLRMPFASGAEVVSQLQQRHSTIAPLILTGHGDVPTAVAMLKQGVVDFLQKPIQAEPLQAAPYNKRGNTHSSCNSSTHGAGANTASLRKSNTLCN